MPNDLLPSEGPGLEAIMRSSQGKFASVLAGAIDPEKFVDVAIFLMKNAGGRLEEAIRNQPALFMSCAYQAATLGLSMNPLLGEFYIVPRKSKEHGGRNIPTPMVGYLGLVKRVRRIDTVLNVRAGVVRDGDTFEVTDGTAPSIVHTPAMSSDPREVTAAWACIDVRDAPPLIATIDSWAIEQARQRSDSGKYDKGPWWTDYGPMAQKTVLRRACKLAPLDDATREAVTSEERQESAVVVTQMDSEHESLTQALEAGETDGQQE